MRVILVILIFLTQTSLAQSTDTVYYGIDGIVASKDSAVYVRYYNYDSSSNRYKYKEWSLAKLSHGYEGSGELKSINPEIKDGEFKEIDQLGNHVTYKYKENIFVDIIDYRDDEGTPLTSVYPLAFVDSTFNKKEFLIKQSVQIRDSVRARASIDQLNSCTMAIAQFVIEVDGSSSNISVIKGCYNVLDEQIIELIKKNKFVPFEHFGKTVRTLVTVPIRIKK